KPSAEMIPVSVIWIVPPSLKVQSARLRGTAEGLWSSIHSSALLAPVPPQATSLMITSPPAACPAQLLLVWIAPTRTIGRHSANRNQWKRLFIYLVQFFLIFQLLTAVGKRLLF